VRGAGTEGLGAGADGLLGLFWEGAAIGAYNNVIAMTAGAALQKRMVYIVPPSIYQFLPISGLV
jgi:hypothetical protein